jgi:TonB family protein
MKTKVLALMLGIVAVTSLQAAFEPIKIEVTVEPGMPAILRMTGLRDGRVTLALDVNAAGRLTDCLVIAASHAELIRPCMEAVKEWRYRPARYNGEAVSARIELVINMSQTGAVVSRTTLEALTDFFEQVAGRHNDYEICPASAVDRPLVALNRVSPVYDRDAQKAGVGGKVSVHFYVDEQGNVRLPAVPADTHPYLSSVAVEAMRGWKFAPPTRNGRPVLVAAVQEFNFGNAP